MAGLSAGIWPLHDGLQSLQPLARARNLAANLRGGSAIACVARGVGKDHRRFEVRNHTVSTMVDWYAAERSYPGAARFPQLTTIAMVESRIERGHKIETERRSYISSRALSAAAFAQAARGHWAIENKLHWILDVTFKEDRSRLRAGRGAKNMAVVRHFALNLVRQVDDKRSIKRRRERASWDPQYLLEILGPRRCYINLDSLHSLPWQNMSAAVAAFLENGHRGCMDLDKQPGRSKPYRQRRDLHHQARYAAGRRRSRVVGNSADRSSAGSAAMNPGVCP
jgi:predicted transposase YbfD/YdcC